MTPKTVAVLDSLLDRFGRHHKNICIAGGACVDIDRAADIDIFIHHIDEWDATSDAQALADSLLRMFPYRAKRGVGINAPAYNNNQSGIVVQGDAYDPVLKKCIQIMTVTAGSPQEVIDKFDISTHMVAYDVRRVVYHGIHYTTPDVPPMIYRPSMTRYIKICRRYGHVPDPMLLGAMSHEIEAEKEKPKHVDFPSWAELAGSYTYTIAQPGSVYPAGNFIYGGAGEGIAWSVPTPEPDEKEESPFEAIKKKYIAFKEYLSASNP